MKQQAYPESSQQKNLTRVAAHGVKWTGIGAVIVMVLQLVQLVILSRLLDSMAFGLMELTLIAFGFLVTFSMLGSGFTVVQEKELSDEQLNSLFVLAIVVGAVLATALFFASSLVGLLYREPEVVPLIQIISSLLLVQGLSQLYQFLLERHLRFRVLALIRVLSVSTGFIATVSLAIYGWGVYAMLTGFMVNYLLIFSGSVLAGWRHWQPRFDLQPALIKDQVKKGLYVVGSQAINFFNASADRILIGLLLGTRILGYYSFAWRMVVQPMVRINPILTRTSFPFFARIQGDSQRAQSGYLKVLRVLSFIDAPILVGVAVVAPVMVPVIFGAKWLPAVPAIQILAFVIALRSFNNPVGYLLLAHGRTDREFYWNIGIFISQFTGVWLGATVGGLAGVALALLVLQIIYTPLNYFLLVRPVTGRCGWKYTRSIGEYSALATVMGLSVLGLQMLITAHKPVVLASSVLFGALVYAALSFTFLKSTTFGLFRLLLGRNRSEASEGYTRQ